MTTEQPEALRLAAMQNKAMTAKFGKEGFDFHVEADTVIAMLDRIAELDAIQSGYDAARLEIASLHSQLEAVGAGGVSPLMPRPVFGRPGTRDVDVAAAQKAWDAAQAQPPAIGREALMDLIAERLSGTYHCTRVWSAWGVGTMSQDDFEDVGESDTPGELADEILAALASQAKPVGAVPVSSFGYFAYCSEMGYEDFKTEAEARKCADDLLKEARGEAEHDGEWPDVVESIVWGAVIGKAVEIPIDDDTSEYHIKDAAAPQPAAKAQDTRRCCRSHPHENQNAYCQLREVSAWLRWRVAARVTPAADKMCQYADQIDAVAASLPAAPAQPVDEKDSECEIPPLGWRCTRTRGHDGPCAAVESPEDKAFVERGMRRIRDAEDAGRYRLLKRGQHWSVIDGAGSTLRAEALDAAIDAAIAAQQGGAEDAVS